MKHRIKGALAPLVEAAMLLFGMGTEEAGCHHRRQRQRHHHRDGDRHRQRHREFAEQAADDAAHQEQRDQDGDQRDADRHDREADFARALERRGERFLPFFYVAGDIFEHDNGVVDHEADGNRERHQRQIVERVAEYPHQRAGAEQGKRDRDCRDDGRPETAQEQEDDHHHKGDGDHQGELDIRDRCADGLGAVAHHVDLDGRRDRCHQSRQRRLDLVDGIDDVGAGLLEDHQEHATLAVGPRCLFGVFRPGHRLADVAYPQRTAIAVGDDHVIPILGLQQLVVGVDRVGLGNAVDIAFGTVDRRIGDDVADVLQREAFGDQFGRIDLNPDRRLLLAADDDLGDAGNHADLLRELGVHRIADRGQGQRIRGRRQ